jgi:hypothetical protein
VLSDADEDVGQPRLHAAQTSRTGSSPAGWGRRQERCRRPPKSGVGAFYHGYSNDLKEALAPLVTLRDEYGVELFYDFANRRSI